MVGRVPIGERNYASWKVIRLYKGSALVPAFAGIHSPGRARQHFDLFDSTFDRVKAVNT